MHTVRREDDGARPRVPEHMPCVQENETVRGVQPGEPQSLVDRRAPTSQVSVDLLRVPLPPLLLMSRGRAATAWHQAQRAGGRQVLLYAAPVPAVQRATVHERTKGQAGHTSDSLK